MAIYTNLFTPSYEQERVFLFAPRAILDYLIRCFYIPAYAGESFCSYLFNARYTVHPRTRGRSQTHALKNMRMDGASPQSQGNCDSAYTAVNIGDGLHIYRGNFSPTYSY